MKLFIKVFVSVIAIAILSAGGFIFYMTRGLESGKNMTINTVDLSRLNDGIYTGKYAGGRWSNEVNVTVSDKKITNISAVKTVVFEKEEVTQSLFDRILKKQNTDVDAISGATVTCKAYMKSIENALSK